MPIYKKIIDGTQHKLRWGGYLFTPDVEVTTPFYLPPHSALELVSNEPWPQPSILQHQFFVFVDSTYRFASAAARDTYFPVPPTERELLIYTDADFQQWDGIVGWNNAIDLAHFFVDAAARDAYFTAPSPAPTLNMLISTASVIQRWNGTVWVNIAAPALVFADAAERDTYFEVNLPTVGMLITVNSVLQQWDGVVNWKNIQKDGDPVSDVLLVEIPFCAEYSLQVECRAGRLTVEEDHPDAIPLSVEEGQAYTFLQPSRWNERNKWYVKGASEVEGRILVERVK